MALYLDACIAESDGDAAFIAKALGDIARAKGMSEVARDAGLSAKACTRPYPASGTLTSRRFSPSHAPWEFSCTPRRQHKTP
jgi:probable addiction module antidote protein